MRISRLDLTRYGCFTNQQIVFNSRQDRKPDLHIIYGRNEAGKSTLLNAYMDLLFGIGTQTPFGFLHPYNTMRIGALLEFLDGEQEFIRIKKPQGSLLNNAERPIGEGLIQRELGGLDRERYRTMFSLDDASLQEGGQSILANKGDLGVLLFSASAGLADLGQRLVEVRNTAETFYKFHAKKGELRDLKTQLDEIKAQRTQLDMQASAYAELIKTRDRLQKEYKEAIEGEGRTSARIAEINRLLLALPEAAELKHLQTQLSLLQSLPKAPASWTTDLELLKKEEAVQAAEESRIERDLARVQTEIDALTVDEIALGVQTEMGRFKELRSRSVGSAVDLPAKREERIACKGTIDGILVRMERANEENPEHLILRVSKSGSLQRLIESWSGVASKQQTATEERKKAEIALSLAKVSGLNLPGSCEAEIASLSDLLREVSTIDYARKVSLAQKALNTARSKQDQQLKLLAPWSGTVDELLAMECPSIEQVQSSKAGLSDAAEKVDRLDAEYDRLNTEREEIELQLGAISAATGVLSDQELKEIRQERDAAWLKHKHDLQVDSAQVFEDTLQHHDEAIDNRFTHLSETEKHRQLQVRFAYLQASLVPAQQKLDTASEAYKQMCDRIAEKVVKISPSLASFSTDLVNLETWLSRRDKAIEYWESVVAARQIKTDADIELAGITTSLAEALAKVGRQVPQGSDIIELIDTARQVTSEFDKQQATRKRIAELEESVIERQREEAEAQKHIDVWESNWAEACSSCWIGDFSLPTIDTVREILAELPRLQTELTELKNIDRRIQGMEADEEELLSESMRHAKALSLDGKGTASEIATRIEAYIESVQETVLALDRKKQERARFESEKIDLADEREQHTTRKSEMVKMLGVDSLAEIELKLAEIKKRDALVDRVADQQASIMRILGKGTIAEAETVVASAVQEDLNTELAKLNGILPDQQSRPRELYAEFCKAKDRVEAIGADAKIAELEEQRRTNLLEINERAEEYLRLRAGVLAAEIALQSYRERHRSTMLQRASDTFRQICSDKYDGLEAQPSGSSETLIARVSSGGSRTEKDLSDGTRRQLYFSLRIAGYHEFVRSHPSLPFIADDLLESFDNLRAGETFKLLTEMSEHGQVIYLTHHEHLCDIARGVCPSVSIYNLQETSA
jgi:uncharacterized protein YhaN